MRRSGQAIARLQQGTSAAATTLLKLLIDQTTPASVKVRVADSIFNHAAKAIEIEDIEARLAAFRYPWPRTREPAADEEQCAGKGIYEMVMA